MYAIEGSVKNIFKLLSGHTLITSVLPTTGMALAPTKQFSNPAVKVSNGHLNSYAKQNNQQCTVELVEWAIADWHV